MLHGMATEDSPWRKAIGILAMTGTFAFGSAWLYSFIDPLFAESIARDIVRTEVEGRVEARLEELQGSDLAAIAVRVSGRNASEIAELRHRLAAEVPRQVAAVAARMLDADCACRRKIEARVTDGFAGRIADLASINERLAALIRTQYLEVASALTREFRIFTGANALLFALLGALAVFRGRAGMQLLVPAAILVASAIVVGAAYLFGQDWLHTIVFGDYVGFAYFAYLGVAVALLADIALNRARVTTELLNGLFHLIGSALQAVPC
jgi:hypothetical protein